MMLRRDEWSGLGRRVRGAKSLLRLAVLASAIAGSGCASMRPATWFDSPPDPGVATPMTPHTVSDAARASVAYDRDPKSESAALAYARALRELGSNRAAADALARTLQFHPDNAELMAEYAKALTGSGSSKEALPVFETAEQLERPDWSLLSAHGIALDQLGRHTEARERYQAALKLSPDNPDVMCNLALSDTLSGNLNEAEVILRRAVSQPGAGPQARQNLALVLGLEGQFTEAEGLVHRDLDPAAADHNVAVLRELFAQPELWADSHEAGAGAQQVASADPPSPHIATDAAVSNANGPTPTLVAAAALPVVPLRGSGITGAVGPARVAIPAAPAKPAGVSAHATRGKASTQVPPNNGVDETFFAFGW